MVPDKKSEEFMKTLFIVTLIVLAVLIVLSIVLAIIGKKAKKKSDDQREAMMAQSQVMSFYIIDKKKMKLSEANMPKVVTDNLPKMVKRAKMPVLKVKVGPKVMSLIADEEVFKSVLPKQEVKADVAGIYVLSARRVRGPVSEAPKTKAEIKAEKKAAKEKAKLLKKQKNKY